MIQAVFYTSGGHLNGFEMRGHSTRHEDDLNGRLICASASSAALLVSNTLTEILKADAEIKCEDGYLKLELKNASPGSLPILEGLHLHLNELSKEYPKRIKVIMEVKNNA